MRPAPSAAPRGSPGTCCKSPVAPPLPGVRDVVLQQAAQALGDVARAYAARPDKLVAAHLDLADAHARLARTAWSRMRGEDAAPVALPAPGDRRFSHPDWQHNPLLDGLKQSYLVTARWADDVVANADGLDPHTRRKARFYAAQIAEALSPTNVALTNPQVMRTRSPRRRQPRRRAGEPRRRHRRGRRRARRAPDRSIPPSRSAATSP
jgi:hypothetical protein